MKDTDMDTSDFRQTVQESLLTLSARLASFHDMAVLGEGNVSGALPSGRFLVKASGTSLKRMDARSLVEVEAGPLLAAVEGNADLSDAEVEEMLFGVRTDPEALKPSVESLFHAWLLALDGVDFVGHAHPLAAISVLSSPYAEAYATRRLFPDQIVYCGPESVLLPYIDPGLTLSRRIAEAVEGYRERSGRLPKTICMQNHGVIAIGKTAQDAAAGLIMAEKSARVFIDAAALGGPEFLHPEEVTRIDERMDERYRQRILRQSG